MPHFIHATKASQIPYIIRPGRYERFTAGQSEFSCELACPYDQRFAFAADFLGYANVDPDGGDKFTRVLPEFYEDQDHLPCVSLQMFNPEGNVEALPAPDPVIPEDPEEEPEPTFSPGVTYTFADGTPGLAVFRAIFASVDYPIYEDIQISDGEEWRRFTMIEENHLPESQQIPGGAFRLVDVEGAAGEIMEALALHYFMRELTIHWLLVPHFSRENIEACLDKVNDAEVMFTRGSVHYRYAPETLLFQGWSHRMERSAAGQLLWSLQFRFKWNPFSWNKIFRAFGPTNADYYRYVRKSDNSPPYALTDMLKIFSIVDPVPAEEPVEP